MVFKWALHTLLCVNIRHQRNEIPSARKTKKNIYIAKKLNRNYRVDNSHVCGEHMVFGAPWADLLVFFEGKTIFFCLHQQRAARRHRVSNAPNPIQYLIVNFISVIVFEEHHQWTRAARKKHTDTASKNKICLIFFAIVFCARARGVREYCVVSIFSVARCI